MPTPSIRYLPILAAVLAAFAVSGCAVGPTAPPSLDLAPANEVARDLGMVLLEESDGRVVLDDGRNRIVVNAGLPFALVNDVLRDLPGTPVVRGGRLNLPTAALAPLKAWMAAAPPAAAHADAAAADRPDPRADAAVPDAWRVKAERDWNWIVIHHSGRPRGSYQAIHNYHKNIKGWDGCGYHFVIGNGSLSGDGAVEVGYRWTTQKYGAHTKTRDNRYNLRGIGICLVGNFETMRPSKEQLDALERLVRFLTETYDIPVGNVKAHRDCKSTDCPGRNVSVSALRSRLAEDRGR